MTRNAGFTLIEIMIVVVLIMIVFGMSSVFFAGALPPARLNAAGRELSAMLRYARLLAKTEGEPRGVLIDLDRGRYTIEGVQTRKVPEGVTVRVIDPSAGEVSRGVYPLFFQESGMAQGGSIVLSSGGRAIHVELDPVLGAVVLRRKVSGE